MKHSRVLVVLLLCLSGAIVSASVAEKADNGQRVREYWRRVWSEGDPAAVAEFYDPACQHGENFSIEQFQRRVKRQRESFPDFSVSVDDVIVIGDRVISRVTFRGTHTGRPMFKQEPLGKKIEVPGIDIFTFRDGKCIEHQHVADHLDLVLQMGLRLTPEPAEPKR